VRRWNIIATAKIIAASTSRALPAADVPEFIGSRMSCRAAEHGTDLSLT
jgi:hypothetical protein